MSRMKAIEQALKHRSNVSLKHLLIEWGVELTVYLPLHNTYSKVYGSESGELDKQNPLTVLGIVVSDDFFPSGPSSSGSFQEGWLYTQDNNLKVGSSIEIPSGDGRTRTYKVSYREAIGSTTDVFSRYKLASTTR